MKQAAFIATASAIALALLLSISGCSATQTPNIIDELQTQAQIKDIAIPTQLTDLGILRYGEKVLAQWGLRSQGADVFNTSGQIALAALSTGALAASGGGVSPDITKGLVGGFNFLLQVMGIIKAPERNDARHEGAAMILDARGNFLTALAEKRVYHVSNVRFTPQGALYFKQIGAAIKVVDKLIVGLAPRIKDLQDLEPVAPRDQPDPEPEPPKATISSGQSLIDPINRETVITKDDQSIPSVSGSGITIP